MPTNTEFRAKYSAKLRDPRWQRRRLEILQRDDWACQICFDKETTLNVHHRWYERGAEPWEAPDESLVTLCEDCHKLETEMIGQALSDLCATVRKDFFSYQIIDLWQAFAVVKSPYPPDVLARAIYETFTNDDLLHRFFAAYFETIAERQKTKGGAK